MLMISVFMVPVILSIILNTGHLSECLNGPGIDDFRSHFKRHFYILALFPFTSLKNVILIITPLYLVAEYYYLNWLMVS
jgi:hypothetical protein